MKTTNDKIPHRPFMHAGTWIELKAELYKARRRFLWLMPIGVVFMESFIILTNGYMREPEVTSEGWFVLLYQLPLYNTIFLPLVLAAMASRVCDEENKGNTYKLLCTLQEKVHIFDIKILTGFLYMLLLTGLEGCNILLLGRLLSFEQTFPLRHFLIFLAVLFLVSMGLYLMQLLLSLLLTNQLMPLFIGLVGSLVGLFSAFFPLGKLAELVPWGYYMVGSTFSSWYDRETRTSYVYERTFNWAPFIVFLTAVLLLYMIGKRIFLKKEV